MTSRKREVILSALGLVSLETGVAVFDLASLEDVALPMVMPTGVEHVVVCYRVEQGGLLANLSGLVESRAFEHGGEVLSLNVYRVK